MKTDEKIKVHTETKSDLPGLWGMTETVLRKFKGVAFFLALIPIFLLYILCIGLAASPGFAIFDWVLPQLQETSWFFKGLSLGLCFGLSYLLYALCLVLVVPLVNKILPLRLKESRGNWYSLQVIPWYYHNALVQLVRYTVLDLMTPTPLNMFFFKAMGMKMGKNCIINTTNISDPCLIELGDYVTIGGSATMFAHYGQGGYLIISKTKIGDYSTVGLKASIMGNVIVGKHCMVSAHSVLLPKTVLQDHEQA